MKKKLIEFDQKDIRDRIESIHGEESAQKTNESILLRLHELALTNGSKYNVEKYLDELDEVIKNDDELAGEL